MKHKAAMQRYLDAVSAADLEAIYALFAPDALVHSPTQGRPLTPQTFYPGLLARAKGTVFIAKSFFQAENPDRAAVLFDYRKPFTSGGMNVFDCVDIFDFDDAGKITEICIILDTGKFSMS